MNITMAMCEAILKTLPVGYYCGRRIPVNFDGAAETSYYVPMEDAIYISFPIIKKGVERLPEGSDLEQSVRSMLYHETSHAILTPPSLIANCSEERAQVLNIFEDERIETLLRDYYMNVDFKKQLYSITGGPVNPPKNVMQYFYNAVRFGNCPEKKWLNKIDELMNRYKKINRNSDIWTTDRYNCEVWRLYYDMCHAMPSMPTECAGFDGDIAENTNGGEGPETGSKECENESVSTEKSENKSTGDCTGALAHGISINSSEIAELIDKGLSVKNALSESQQKQVSDFEKMVNMLFTNFNKKTGSGSGINSYSGVFNPRATMRDDYRYFERSIVSNGNNKFGSLHLNLILDRSGSFYYNQDLTNAIIQALSNIEHRNKNFKMDIFFINEDIKKAETLKDREMNCNGGNRIPEKTAELFRKAQLPNTFNYNIVLFDGDAFSDEYDITLAERQKKFKIFDKKQTYLITDSDNKRYMHKPFTAAKVIVTSNYTDELIKNLSRAFKTMLS